MAVWIAEKKTEELWFVQFDPEWLRGHNQNAIMWIRFTLRASVWKYTNVTACSVMERHQHLKFEGLRFKVNC